MPEFRRDPIGGYWTIISTERSRRPVEFHAQGPTEERECPFCEGREAETTQEVFAIRPGGAATNTPGWEVRAIVSKMPILPEGAATEAYGQGIYDIMDGIGKHEIIIESPKHCHDLDEMDPAAVEKVVQAYIHRINAFEKDPSFKYALLFKNHGLTSGSVRDVIRHSRSQLIGLPVIPKRVKEELALAKSYFERRERCVFCDVLKQETKETLRIVAENEFFLAFCPFASRAPFEMWIMPKWHQADFGRLDEDKIRPFAELLRECLIRLRDVLDDPAYNFILHTAPFRHMAKAVYWKTINEDYHWYLQISPRLTKNAGFEWGTGVHINPTPPEDAAQLLREAQV
ncbi:MAG: galactose-1-phosphate uridylyltransferase [Candidatus Omnitrophica bacterium]|nr:galactose-1-phosphate uridylyltransferase [Candidatus Omnitrophota bacterium]